MIFLLALLLSTPHAIAAVENSDALVHPSPNLSFEHLPKSILPQLKLQFPNIFIGPTSPGEADKVLKWLHQALDFDLVQLWQTDENKYEFRVIKRARIKEIIWRGLGPLSESEVQRLFGIQVDDVFEVEAVNAGLERVERAYQELGYLQTRIRMETPPRKDGHRKLLFVVNEGPPTQIQSIQFLSPNEALNKSLKRSLETLFRETLTQDSVDRLIKGAKDYLIEKKYSRAEISAPEIILSPDRTSATLQFKIDKIEKYDFQFKGNYSYTKLFISESLDLENFYSANSNIGTEIAQKIKSFYLKEGFARVEVTAEEKDDHQRFQKNLIFNIVEGVRYQVEKIQVIGRLSREESYYAKTILKNSSPLVQKGYYVREDIEAAATNLKLELQNQGYLLAKIITIRTPINKDRNKVPVLITLDEGPLTEIDAITFEGNDRISTSELSAISKLSSSGPLRLGQVELALQNIKNHYRHLGFLEMSVENEKSDLVTYSENNAKAHVRFKIFEGPQVRVAAIVIEGNSFTKDRIILNEVDFSIGEILTPQKLEDSIYRLQRTGYFGSVTIRTLEEKTSVSARTVVIQITERDPGLFAMGFGVTNERKFTVRGYTGIAYRNIQGSGRGVSLRVEANYNVAEIKYPEYKATAGYLEPYLLDSKFRGRVNVTRSRLVTDALIRKASEAVQTTFSIERDITSHITGIWDVYSLASSKDFSIDNDLDETLLDIATTGFSLDVDYRNSLFNPTQGSIFKFNIEFSSPQLKSSPTIEYWKSTMSFTNYQPLYKNSVIWTNSLRFGYLRNLSDPPDGGVPYDKKGFILGGRSTLRGFEAGTDEVFPNRTDLGLKGTSTSDSFILKETAKMGLIKSEITFPLVGNFSGALFYDGGSVILSEREFSDNYRDSIGFGFRYNTPVGPLSLDLGWKLDRKAGEDTARYHLSFGTF